MSNLDYDSLINQLKRSTKDPKANLALGKLSQMLQTREGQELAQSFMQSADPNAMARAAQCAQAGDRALPNPVHAAGLGGRCQHRTKAEKINEKGAFPWPISMKPYSSCFPTRKNSPA